MKQATFSKLAVGAAALLLAGQAFGHTIMRDRDFAVEGTRNFNDIVTTHGCGGDGGQGYPVIGQSAVFPFGQTAVWRDPAGNVIPATDDNTNNGGGIISTPRLSLGLSLIDGSSNSKQVHEIVDELGNVRGGLWKGGAMAPNLWNKSPFAVNLPTLVNNCHRLRIRVGIVNYCDTNKNALNDAAGPWKAPKDAWGQKIPFVRITDVNNPGYLDGLQKNVYDSDVYKNMPAGNGDNNRADWWFQVGPGGIIGSTKYTDPDLAPTANYWSGYITVNNSAAQLATCPLDANGQPVVTTYTVEPHGTDFDTILSGPNTRPFTNGDTNL